MSLEFSFIYYTPLKLSKGCECDFLETPFGVNDIKVSTPFSFVLLVHVAHQAVTQGVIVDSQCGISIPLDREKFEARKRNFLSLL